MHVSGWFLAIFVTISVPVTWQFSLMYFLPESCKICIFCQDLARILQESCKNCFYFQPGLLQVLWGTPCKLGQFKHVTSWVFGHLVFCFFKFKLLNDFVHFFEDFARFQNFLALKCCAFNYDLKLKNQKDLINNFFHHKGHSNPEPFIPRCKYCLFQ